jgi:hypothetical protein
MLELSDSVFFMQPWFGGLRLSKKSTKIQLGRIQSMACLAITGAIKLTPTAAVEVLLNLTPLELLGMAEARMALSRLQILKQLNVPRTVSGLLTFWRNVGGPSLGMQSAYIIPVCCYTKNFLVKIYQENWENKDSVRL